MTISVSSWRVPVVSDAGPMHIGQPVSAGLMGGLGANVAHLLGAQLSMVICQAFGRSEEPSATGDRFYRYRFHTSPNARSIVVALIPYGYRSAARGSMEIGAAETVKEFGVEQDASLIVGLDQLRTHDTFWTVPVTPDAENDLLIRFTDSTPHTIAAWETPRETLTGTQPHVDASIGDASRYITDDESASDPRGYKAILNGIQEAKRTMRRHPIMGSWPGGMVENSAAFVYLCGSAVAGDGLRVYTREVNKTGVAEAPLRMYFYIDTDRDGTPGGAGTHTLRILTGSATGIYDLAGLNGAVAGWVGPLDVAVLDGVDHVKLQARRTAGASGTIEVSSWCAWETYT